MNKKHLIFLLVAMLSSMATFAQPEGFARIQNNGSKRYLSVRDCTGDISTLGADMGALELWSGLDNAVSDPGSVMYLKNSVDGWDITSQATGVHELTGRYMSIYFVNGIYMVYNSGQYLYEIGTSDFYPDLGILGAKSDSEMQGKGIYKTWNIITVDSNTDNYFGFKPTVTANGKYYASFYADFAYTPLNENIKTWYVAKVDKEHAIAVIKEITGTVAKSQPVFIECAGASTSDNKINLTTEAGNAATANLMKGAFFSNADRSFKNHPTNPAVVVFDASTMRVLDIDANGNLAFVNSSSNLTNLYIYKDNNWDYADCIPHNTSYLTVDADCPATLRLMNEAEYEEYIKSLEPTYTLGDVNGDGKVSITDVPAVMGLILNADADALNRKAADMNADGKVTFIDMSILMNKVANKK